MALDEYPRLCKGGCGRVLTTEQMHTNNLCEVCGKRHAEVFPEVFKKLGEDNDEQTS